MAGNLTRIKNNQVTDAAAGNTQVGINAGVKVQNYSITATKIANNLTYGSDLTITGNLTVQGTTTAVNTVNTTIQDPLIVLADGQTSGSPSVDIGYVGLRGSQNSAALVWKESQLGFVTALTTTDVGGTGLSNTTITVSSYANLATGNLTAQGTTSLVGNVVGAANFTANVTGGNLLTAGIVSATSNVTGGNLLTGGIVSSTGNATHGNLLVTGTGIISTAGNIYGANLIISANESDTGNIQAGNLLTGGLISASGNITGNYFIGNGSQLTGVTASSVNANALTGNTLNSGVIFSSLTTVGTLTSLSVSGNIAAGNISATNHTGTNVSVTGTQTAASTVGGVITGSSSSVTGTQSAASTVGGVITGSSSSVTGTQTAASTVGGVITGSSASVTGNVTANSSIIGVGATTTGNLAGVFGTANTALHAAAIITAAGSANTSAQFAFQNNNNGSNASTDIAVYNNLGTDTTYFIDMGITSSGFNGTAYGANIYGANDGYLYVVGNSATGPVGSGANIGNLILGSTNGQVIVFVGNASTSNAVTVTGPTGFSVTGAITATGNANIGNATFFVNQATGTASFGNSTQTTNALVAFNSSTSILMPAGNTTQRPGTGVTGMLRFNSTINAMEVFNNTAWATVGQQTFTVIADDQFSGDGSTVAFTLTSSQTTNSCIVSINGIVQIPTTAYAVSGTTLTFTEAPAAGDLIDVREVTTTTSVTSLSNGGTAITLDGTNINVTGNFNPTANVTYTLGNATNRWSNLYLSGSTIYLGALQLKATNATTFGVYQADGSTLANVAASGLSVTSITDGTSAYQFDGVNGNAVITVGGANIIAVTSGGINNLQANGVGNIGTSTSTFNTVFAKATTAQYADLAEKYTADAEYAPGTVVVFGGTHEVTVNAVDADRKVAGVVSTNPGFLMNEGLNSEFAVAIALTGRVPCMVVGPVKKGDLMVAAGLGRARAEADPRVGTVIGKALEDFDGAEGTIEVVVGRF